MKILAIDTSTFVSSAALYVTGDGGDRVVRTADSRATTHSEQLLPLIDQVLGDVAPAELDLIACGAGPGSFTGLRIGLATAKGLAYALGKPLVLISSLAALAHEASPGADVLAVLDARKHEVYAGMYRGETALKPETVIAPARLFEYTERADLVVIGDGALAYPDEAARCGTILKEARTTPAAAAIAALAARRQVDDLLITGEPTYIRPSEAEIPKPRKSRNI